MKTKNILLIEDNPSDIALALRAFQKSQIINPIVVLEDGQEALDYIFCKEKYKDRDINDSPALILLDLKLPIVDGMQVLKEIRDNPITRSYIIVILTSSKEDQDILHGYEIGTNSYIRKPVDFNEFTEVIKQIGFYWLLLNEPPLTTHK